VGVERITHQKNVRVTTPVGIAAAEVSPTALAEAGAKKGMRVGRLGEIGMPVSPVIPLRVSWIRLAAGGSIRTPYAPAGPVVETNVPDAKVMELTWREAKAEAIIRGPMLNVPPWKLPVLELIVTETAIAVYLL
jgi:hypothetical protein